MLLYDDSLFLVGFHHQLSSQAVKFKPNK